MDLTELQPSLIFLQQLQADMPVAYSQVVASGQSLLEAAGRLSEDPTSMETRPLLMTAAQGVLEGTMKVSMVVMSVIKVCLQTSFTSSYASHLTPGHHPSSSQTLTHIHERMHTHTHTTHTHTQVLLVWDDGEVRKILRIADWVLDRLGLVQGAKSMRGLVICFGVGKCPPQFLHGLSFEQSGVLVLRILYHICIARGCLKWFVFLHTSGFI